MTSEYDTFFTPLLNKKNDLEFEIDKFKSTYEEYDIESDSSYVTLHNIDLSNFVPLLSPDETNNCKEQCSSDNTCVAFSSTEQSCNLFSNINLNINNGDEKVQLLKNKENIKLVAQYLQKQNTDIISIANTIKGQIENYNGIDYMYDETNIQKINLDNTFNSLQERQQEKQNLIASHKLYDNPIVVNTEYFRYILFFILMFIMFIIFTYYIVDNDPNNTTNFVLYLVLFVIILSITITYFLQ